MRFKVLNIDSNENVLNTDIILFNTKINHKSHSKFLIYETQILHLTKDFVISNTDTFRYVSDT